MSAISGTVARGAVGSFPARKPDWERRGPTRARAPPRWVSSNRHGPDDESAPAGNCEGRKAAEGARPPLRYAPARRRRNERYGRRPRAARPPAHRRARWLRRWSRPSKVMTRCSVAASSASRSSWRSSAGRSLSPTSGRPARGRRRPGPRAGEDAVVQASKHTTRWGTDLIGDRVQIVISPVRKLARVGRPRSRPASRARASARSSWTSPVPEGPGPVGPSTGWSAPCAARPSARHPAPR